MKKLAKDALVIDVECGRTNYSALSLSKYNIIGVDISRNELLKAIKLNREMNFVMADANYLPFRHEIADVIMCIAVLGSPRINLKRFAFWAREILKSNGYIIIVASLKNACNIFDPAILLRKWRSFKIREITKIFSRFRILLILRFGIISSYIFDLFILIIIKVFNKISKRELFLAYFPLLDKLFEAKIVDRNARYFLVVLQK